MPALAITGSIGSGKSAVLQALGALLRAETFCADQENRQLLDNDQTVRHLICTQLGNSCYHTDGSANRKFLFDLISRDQSARSTLESILHPRLQQIWKPLAQQFRKNPNNFFIAEIPLLYEKQLEVFFDKIIVVGCSDQIRRERLHRLRSINSAESAAWSTMQGAQEIKAAKAHHLLWNDGSEAQLHFQIQLLASHFLNP